MRSRLPGARLPRRTSPGVKAALTDAQLAELAQAVLSGHMEHTAALHIAIRDAALASGLSLVEAEAEATRLVAALVAAEAQGPDAIAAITAEIDTYIITTETAVEETDGLTDAINNMAAEAEAAMAAARAAYEDWAASVGISNETAQQHNRAYYEGLADQLRLSGATRKAFIEGNLENQKVARKVERESNRKALQDEADALNLNEKQKGIFVKAGLQKIKDDRKAARIAERVARKADREEFKKEQQFQRDQIKRTMDSAIRWSNDVGRNWSRMLRGMLRAAEDLENDLVGGSVFPDTVDKSIDEFDRLGANWSANMGQMEAEGTAGFDRIRANWFANINQMASSPSSSIDANFAQQQQQERIDANLAQQQQQERIDANFAKQQQQERIDANFAKQQQQEAIDANFAKQQQQEAIARQHGGPVRARGSYVVGEAGPELFVPSQSGRIVPHGSAGGAGVDPKALARAVADALEGTEINVDGRKLGRLTVRHQPLAAAELGGRR